VRLYLFALAVALAVAPIVTRATEEPDHEVLRTLDNNVEIRHYAPYVVAEVFVRGSADTAGNDAFPILAGYIFGKNKGERRMAMTAPVTQTPAPVKLEMTAPVIQTAVADGWIVQFVLPKGVTLDLAPEPIDSRVKLREVTGRHIAAIRYSGFWSTDNYEGHLDKLRAVLTSEGFVWSGEPVFSRYNPPFTPWFLRRNEIWLSLSSEQFKEDK